MVKPTMDQRLLFAGYLPLYKVKNTSFELQENIFCHKHLLEWIIYPLPTI